MKSLFNLFLISTVALIAVSCAGLRYVASEVTPAQMTDLARIEPISYIELIENGNRLERNDSLTVVAQDLLNATLAAVEPMLPPTSGPEVLASADPAAWEITREEILGILAQVTTKKKIKNMPVPPLLDEILTDSGQRYGLMVVQTGFSRRKGNYGGQVAKGLGLGILTAVATGGMMTAYYTPIKAKSILHAFIVDAERNNIVFYNKVETEAEPCDPKVLKKQVDKLFRKVFW